MIPDPADLNVEEKNLLILDDCFLGKQNKAKSESESESEWKIPKKHELLLSTAGI